MAILFNSVLTEKGIDPANVQTEAADEEADYFRISPHHFAKHCVRQAPRLGRPPWLWPR
jgi:hypothetical protein